MNFKIQVLGESQSGSSYFVKVNEAVKTGFGDMLTEVGIGYITKNEGVNLSKGDVVAWNGNIQFAPIVDANGVTTMVNGQYLHRVNLVSDALPFVAPIKATIVAPVAKPAEVTDGPVPNDGNEPF